jgi:hypothetical protein
MEKKTPEPSPEVLDEIKHQNEIKEITRSTQKLMYELQNSKIKLALLKLTREIDSLSTSTTSYDTAPAPLETADKTLEEVSSEDSLDIETSL